MSRGDLERWVAEHRDDLAARGVRVLFGFSPSFGSADGPSWASFVSGRGSGRVVRDADGSSSVDAYAFADGACLRSERHDRVSIEQLQSVADTLAVQAVVR